MLRVSYQLQHQVAGNSAKLLCREHITGTTLVDTIISHYPYGVSVCLNTVCTRIIILPGNSNDQYPGLLHILLCIWGACWVATCRK